MQFSKVIKSATTVCDITSKAILDGKSYNTYKLLQMVSEILNVYYIVVKFVNQYCTHHTLLGCVSCFFSAISL